MSTTFTSVLDDGTEPGATVMTKDSSDADIHTDDGQDVHYHVDPVTGDPQTYPSDITDEDGTTIYHRGPDGKLMWIQLPDGSKYKYCYDANGNLTGIIFPGETEPRLLLGHPQGSGDSCIYTFASLVADPANPPADPGNPAAGTASAGRFGYVTVGGKQLFHTLTRQNGMGYVYDYYDSGEYAGRIKMIRKMNDDGVYAQTGFQYSTQYDSSSSSQLVTTVRQYANCGTRGDHTDPNDFGTPGEADDTKDRRCTYVFYPTVMDSNFTQSETETWQEGAVVHTHKVEYSVDTDPDSGLFGSVMSETETGADPRNPSQTLSRTISYDYYNPKKLYKHPDAGKSDLGDQYYLSSPGNVPYVESETGVPGNGEMMRKSITSGQTTYTTTYRYQITDTSYSGSVMTLKPIIVKDSLGNVQEAVRTSTGKVSEVWLPGDDGKLRKVAALDYWDASGTNGSKDWNRLKTATLYDVGTSPTDKDAVIHFAYTYDTDSNGDTIGATTTATLNGKTFTSHQTALGMVDWETDENGHKTDYAHDYLGKLTSVKFPAVDNETEQQRKSIQFTYMQCCGLLGQVQNEEGKSTYYGYDSAGRLSNTWTDAQIVGGNKIGDLASATRALPFGQVDSVSTFVMKNGSPAPRTYGLAYNGRGMLNKITFPHHTTDGDLIGSQEALYDDFGRLCAVKDANGKVTVAEYDTFDRITKIKYDYGSFAFPINITNPDIQVLYQDVAQPVMTVAERIDGNTVSSTYAFDRLGRLKSYTPAVPFGYGTISYTWNTLDQKTSMTVPLGVGNKGRKYVYNYDSAGRLLGTDTLPATVASSTAAESASASSTTHFGYDAMSNRVKLVNKAGDVYYFVYDPTASIPAVVYEQGTNGTSLNARYLNMRDPDGLLMTRDKYESEQRTESRTYHFNGHGDTVALSDESGTITDNYTYDAWGNELSHTGPGTLTTDNPYQYAGEYGYYTHYEEPTFGFIQTGFRYYDPQSGRYGQLDPAGDGWNWYGYCDGNPSGAVDPLGLFVLTIGKGVMGGVGYGGSDETGWAIGHDSRKSLLDPGSWSIGRYDTFGGGGYGGISVSGSWTVGYMPGDNVGSLRGLGGKVGGSGGELFGGGVDVNINRNGVGLSLSGGATAAIVPVELHGFATYTIVSDYTPLVRAVLKLASGKPGKKPCKKRGRHVGGGGW